MFKHAKQCSDICAECAVLIKTQNTKLDNLDIGNYLTLAVAVGIKRDCNRSRKVK